MCDSTGTTDPTTCSAGDGDCACNPGYTGLKCDTCEAVAYYSSAGSCQRMEHTAYTNTILITFVILFFQLVFVIQLELTVILTFVLMTLESVPVILDLLVTSVTIVT